MFRIKSRKTGLYSVGGRVPRFSRRGRYWNTKATLGAHLAQLSEEGKAIYEEEGCEIEVCEVVKKGTLPIELATSSGEARIGDPLKDLITGCCR